ncbi:MAG: hypothetical protein L6422_11740 [Candidatus Marinimicrobia bacterium]|nr:hypothetical protein [Candidatus Neomarinimicrobiota bacterium]
MKVNGLVKSTNHVILNEVRMKNLSQLSTRFFVASLPQNDSFGSFYETIKVVNKVIVFIKPVMINKIEKYFN